MKVINPKTIVLPLFLAGTTAFVPGVAFIVTSPITTSSSVFGDLDAIVRPNTIVANVRALCLAGVARQGSALDFNAMSATIDGTPKANTIDARVSDGDLY